MCSGDKNSYLEASSPPFSPPECETEPVRDKHPFLRGPFWEFIRQFAVLAALGRATWARGPSDTVLREMRRGFNMKQEEKDRLLYCKCHVLY